jgi:type I restriction enzyme S subunit
MGGEWTETKFASLCDITRGASPRPIHEWVASEGVPWVKISDAQAAGSRYISRTAECIRAEGRSRSVSVHPGDLILSNSATPGIPKFMGVDACIHDGWLLLRNFRGLDKGFAYYLLLHERPALVEKGSGSVFTNLKTEILKNHLVLVPPLAEQRAIAHILGTLDDKIELNRRMNETLEATARALFKSWFVDFDPVRAKMEGRWRRGESRPGLPAHVYDSFPYRLVYSELGEIPDGWEVTALAEHFEAVKGVSYKGSGLCDDGMPLHNLNSVYEGGGYKYEGIKYYSGEYAERHLVQPGDVIVANTEQGHHRFLIGYAALVPELHGQEGIASHHIYRLRPKAGSPLTAAYLCWLLNSPQMHDVVSGYANGTTVNMLPLDGVQKPNMVVPPEVLVSTFDRVAVQVTRRREEMILESRTLAALRDGLLPKLISGELRLNDIARFVEPASA